MLLASSAALRLLRAAAQVKEPDALGWRVPEAAHLPNRVIQRGSGRTYAVTGVQCLLLALLGALDLLNFEKTAAILLAIFLLVFCFENVQLRRLLVLAIIGGVGEDIELAHGLLLLSR